MAEGVDAPVLRERQLIIDGILDALDRIDRVNAVIRECSERSIAVQALLSPPFGYSEVVANHVLDLTVGKQTQSSIEGLRQERRSIAEMLRALPGSE